MDTVFSQAFSDELATVIQECGDMPTQNCAPLMLLVAGFIDMVSSVIQKQCDSSTESLSLRQGLSTQFACYAAYDDIVYYCHSNYHESSPRTGEFVREIWTQFRGFLLQRNADEWILKLVDKQVNKAIERGSWKKVFKKYDAEETGSHQS